LCWFDVNTASRAFVTPPADVVLQACPHGHPRLLAQGGDLAELRRRAASDTEVRKIVAAADRCLDRPLLDLDRVRTKETGSDAFQRRTLAKWASKAFAAQLCEEVSFLVASHLLTGQQRYAPAAVRRAMLIAGLDPDAETSPRISDFADGSCMRGMALTYDSCYDLLTPPQRKQLLDAMRVRAGRFFGQAFNSLEAWLFSAHIWQHILMEAAEVAFATLGEVPEAETWAAYFYELWINRFPPMGGDDGGWAEGLSYEGVNLETMLRAPTLLGRLSHIDLFDLPWYRNAPYDYIYGWPPGSDSAGFGDATEPHGEPIGLRAHFAEALGRHFHDPYALGYAETTRLMGPDRALPPLLVLDRLLAAPGRADFAPRPPSDLPQARVFHDVGLAAMHTDLADAHHDVFLAFCSCPFGGCGHMHPCQNAFNLMVGGRRLFANSGYYIADGDAHYKGWYSTTRAHNAILIDGHGQGDDTECYGRLLGFADIPAGSYCLGDATHAYRSVGLTKARRHVVLLRPSTVVIYDDLAADRAVGWNWLLHSPARIAATGSGVRLEAETAAGKGRAEVFAAVPLAVAINTHFDSPPKNWPHTKDSSGRTAVYPDQWHANVSPQQAAPAMRFLALLEVRLADDRRTLDEAVIEASGRITLGQWRIDACLDAARPAALSVSDVAGRTILAANEDGLAP
jgi:hypothetical protein